MQPGDDDNNGDDEGEDGIHPTAERVARRGRVLYAVASRAAFEQSTDREFAATCRSNLLAWVTDHGLGPELEAHEHAMLHAGIGSLEAHRALESTWHYESAAVLAWALGLMDLPPIGQQVSDVAVGDSFMDRLDSDDPLALRPPEVITAFEELLYNLHWRVRRFAATGGSHDMRRMLSDPPALPGVAPVTFVRDDISVGEGPLLAASPDRANEVHWIVATRRHAASWLCGDHTRYSEVSRDT